MKTIFNYEKQIDGGRLSVKVETTSHTFSIIATKYDHPTSTDDTHIVCYGYMEEEEIFRLMPELKYLIAYNRKRIKQ